MLLYSYDVLGSRQGVPIQLLDVLSCRQVAAIQLLEYFGLLPGCCYTVTKMF